MADENITIKFCVPMWIFNGRSYGRIVFERDERTVSIKRCGRCGKAHKDLVAVPFHKPEGDWTHWTICPNTGDPFDVSFTFTKEHGAMDKPKA